MTYAGWGARVGANLVDGVIIAIPTMIGTGIALATGQPTDRLNAVDVVCLGLALALWFYTRVVQAGQTGQSWGRRALGLRLVDADTCRPIGVGRAFARELAHVVDSLICLVGYLFPLWDARKQTLADKLLRSVVVR